MRLKNFTMKALKKSLVFNTKSCTMQTLALDPSLGKGTLGAGGTQSDGSKEWLRALIKIQFNNEIAITLYTLI